MTENPPETLDEDALLAAALKEIRRIRGLTAAEVAHRMNVSPSTFERFEAGKTRLNLDYIHRFADACGCDPHGLLASIVIRRPAFALHCADNQLATVITAGLQELADGVGADLALLTTRDVVEAVGPMFEALTLKVEASKTARRQAAAALARLESAGGPDKG